MFADASALGAAVAGGRAPGAVVRGGSATEPALASEIPDRPPLGAGCVASGRAPAKAPAGSTTVSPGAAARVESYVPLSKCTGASSDASRGRNPFHATSVQKSFAPPFTVTPAWKVSP